jgi:hypothetical protein
MAVADQPSQPDGATVHEWNAPASAVHAEDRVLGGDAQIAPRRQLEAAGDGVALDGGDDGLAQEHSCRPDRPVAIRRDAAGSRRVFPHGFQVCPGAELAVRTAQHRDEQRLVGFEAAECVDQGLGSGRSMALATSGRSIVTRKIGASVRQ